MKKFLFILLLLPLTQVLQGQEAVTNTGILYISSSTTFYTADNFTNNSGAAFTNNGSFYVKGNLSNSQSSMAVGTGILYLNGTSAQAVNGSQVFKTYHFNSDNSSGITLNNDLSVSGNHTFAAGNIASSATPNYLIYESGSSHSGSGDGKAVTGWVKKIGSSNFTFPVGTNSYLREVAINNLSAASEFNVRYNSATTNTSNVTSPIALVDQYEYWTINKVLGGTAQVTLNWNKNKVDFPSYNLSEIRTSNYTTSWINAGGTATGDVATTGSITSTALSSFGPMAIASTLQTVPLFFLQVKATRYAHYTMIEWKTAAEDNVAIHEVQRSAFANNFSTLGKMTAKNLQAQTYIFNDSSYLEGTAYYRIKSIDRDGKITYSNIVSVNAQLFIQPLTVKTNPVKTSIQIVGGNLAEPYHYALYATNGMLMQKGQVNGGSLMLIPLKSNLPSGAYIFTLSGNGQVLTQKIFVE